MAVRQSIQAGSLEKAGSFDNKYKKQQVILTCCFFVDFYLKYFPNIMSFNNEAIFSEEILDVI